MSKKDLPKIFVRGTLFCEPLVDKLMDPTSTCAMLVFPDFNVFARPFERFTTRSGKVMVQEQLKPGSYVWIDREVFASRGDLCLHWNPRLERVPFEDDSPTLPVA